MCFLAHGIFNFSGNTFIGFYKLVKNVENRTMSAFLTNTYAFFSRVFCFYLKQLLDMSFD